MTCPTTTTPCPSWCTRETGHGYDLAYVDRDTRIHESDFGDVYRGDRIAVSVALMAEEHVAMGDGGVVTSVEPAHIVLDSDSNGLTADQAREVAALLLEAAGKLDEVTAS